MKNNDQIYIKEIFSSIQGESNYVGYKQLFIRFCQCNLNCKFCDTDFSSDLNSKLLYTPEKLIKEIDNMQDDLKTIHSISFTGGEPLLFNNFINNFINLFNNKYYNSEIKFFLETNGTLYQNLKTIIEKIDIISMDIKLNSVTNAGDLFNIHENFLEVAKHKELFIKIVFDSNITNDEIIKCCNLAKKYNREIILQPESKALLEVLKSKDHDKFNFYEIFNKFLHNYKQVKLIPQVHKFLNLA